MSKLLCSLNWIFVIAFCILFMPLVLLNGYLFAALALILIIRYMPLFEIKYFSLILFVLSFALRWLMTACIETPPVSDFALLYDAAQSALRGDMSFANTEYFTLWGYQAGYIMWEMLWLGICNTLKTLQLINALCVSTTIVIVFRIMRQYVKPCYAQIGSLILSLMPFTLLYHNVLSNQIPSAMFLCAAVWLIVCKDCEVLKFARYPLAGILLQLGNILRPEAIIIIVPLIAYAVFKAAENHKNIIRIILKIISVAVCYIAVGMLADYIVRNMGLSRVGLSNLLPGWKFVCGLNAESVGTYSDNLFTALRETFGGDMFVTDETIELQNNIIRSHLSDPGEILRLFMRKINLMWSGESIYWPLSGMLEADWKFMDIPAREWYGKISDVDRCVFYVSALFGGYGLLNAVRSRTLTPAKCIFYFVPFAFTMAMILVEIQPRYTYTALIFVVISACFGIEAFAHRRRE